MAVVELANQVDAVRLDHGADGLCVAVRLLAQGFDQLQKRSGSTTALIGCPPPIRSVQTAKSHRPFRAFLMNKGSAGERPEAVKRFTGGVR